MARKTKDGHFYCSRCKQEKPYRKGTGGTGYAVKRNGHKVCYECCADVDREHMKKEGKIALYLAKSDNGQWYVTNWPGTLKFGPLNPTSGRHNIAGSRSDVWFKGPDGCVWWGVQYGEWTQVCHCKRTKQTTL